MSQRVLLTNAHCLDNSKAPRNLGDYALLEVTRDYLVSRGVEVRLMYGGSSEEPRAGFTEYSLRLKSIVRAIRWADIVVFSGGTLIQDDRPGHIAGLPRFVCTVTFIAALLHTSVCAVGIGADEIRSPIKSWLLSRAVRQFGTLYARDTYSLEVLKTLRQGVSRPRALLGADLYLMANRQVLAERRSHGAKVFALRRPELEAAIDQNVLPDGAIILGMDPDDVQLDGSRNEVLLSRYSVITPHRWQDAVGILEGASLVVASRMHALYFALNGSAKLIGIAANSKLMAFCREFEIDECKSVHEAVNHARLCSEVGPAPTAQLAKARRRLLNCWEAIMSGGGG